MSARYRLTLAVEFNRLDDPTARAVITRNLDALEQVAHELRIVTDPRTAQLENRAVGAGTVRLKLQRLNDDAPPRALVVETL